MNYLIKNATVVNENQIFIADILIEHERITKIIKEGEQYFDFPSSFQSIDAKGMYLIPGVIDDQVHFREPGLTHKGEIYTEAKAAVAGGVTSYMEMPNTNPLATNVDLLEQKFEIADRVSLANYSFFIGATPDNLLELQHIDPTKVCGVKIFMGSSTGSLLVNKRNDLEKIFSEVPFLIALHCEDDTIIKENAEKFRLQYGNEIPVHYHPEIRNAEACYASSSMAVELATKHNARIHILHISTAKELSLFRNDIPLKDKRITSEACIHHLWFSKEDYIKKGAFIKWNPAVKSASDREAILNAVLNDTIDVIATDHAPHTFEEKSNTDYFKIPSGGPLVQHSLIAMFEMHKNGKISLEKLVDKICHKPAELFKVKERGFIREGYYADLVLVNPIKSQTIEKQNILYKCGWSPFEGETFSSSIHSTFVNGHLVYHQGQFDESKRGKRLFFNAI
jgi:dihydroorotase